MNQQLIDKVMCCMLRGGDIKILMNVKGCRAIYYQGFSFEDPIIFWYMIPERLEKASFALKYKFNCDILLSVNEYVKRVKLLPETPYKDSAVHQDMKFCYML